LKGAEKMKLGTIGCGNMAKAILGGIIGKGLICPEDIIAADMYVPGLEGAKKSLGINVTTDNKEAAKADVVVIAIKPEYYKSVIEEIKDVVSEDTIFWTIAPGITLADMENFFGRKIKAVRTMPNTPAMVGAGVTAVTPNEQVTEEEAKYICELIGGFGTAEKIPECLMDATIPVSGSSPAMVFMFIEAMADGAVREGFSREQAYRLCAQTVLGSARMVLETGKHPGELKDMVCTPGGITIELVKKIEQFGFRNAVMEGMEVCTKCI